MKKGWKIALISVGSLLTLIIVGVAVLCWLLFTPARLTSIVNSLAKDYILCENHFGNVSLSLFKTWPNVGVQIDDVVLINPYQVPADDALAACAIHDDTLARVKSLTVGLDLKAFLKDRSVVVHQVRLDDTRANLYTAPDGWSNLDIFPPSTDEEEPDNQESQLPDAMPTTLSFAPKARVPPTHCKDVCGWSCPQAWSPPASRPSPPRPCSPPATTSSPSTCPSTPM